MSERAASDTVSEGSGAESARQTMTGRRLPEKCLEAGRKVNFYISPQKERRGSRAACNAALLASPPTGSIALTFAVIYSSGHLNSVRLAIQSSGFCQARFLSCETPLKGSPGTKESR